MFATLEQPADAPRAYCKSGGRFGPANGLHPVLAFLRDRVRGSTLSLEAISAAAGMHRRSLSRWFHARNSPKLYDLETVLNTLGYTLTVRERDDP